MNESVLTVYARFPARVRFPLLISRSFDLPYFFRFSLFADSRICAFLAILALATSPHGEILRSSVPHVQATRIRVILLSERVGKTNLVRFVSLSPFACPSALHRAAFLPISLPRLKFPRLRVRVCSFAHCFASVSRVRLASVHSPSSRVSGCPARKLARHYSSGIKQRRMIVLTRSPLRSRPFSPLCLSFLFLSFRSAVFSFPILSFPFSRCFVSTQGWRSGCVSRASFMPVPNRLRLDAASGSQGHCRRATSCVRLYPVDGAGWTWRWVAGAEPAPRLLPVLPTSPRVCRS